MCLQVWYFGPNVGHAILGLKPSGCTYLAGELAAIDTTFIMIQAAYLAAIVHIVMSRDALLEVPVLIICGLQSLAYSLRWLVGAAPSVGAKLHVMMHA